MLLFEVHANPYPRILIVLVVIIFLIWSLIQKKGLNLLIGGVLGIILNVICFNALIINTGHMVITFLPILTFLFFITSLIFGIKYFYTAKPNKISSDNKYNLDELEKLAKLKEKNIITEEEFIEKKKKILNQ